MTTKTSKRRANKAAKAAVKAGAVVVTATPAPTANVLNRRIGDTRANVSKYVRCKTVNGNVSLNNGDSVAKKLVTVELADIYGIVAKELDVSKASLVERYKHLNVGMQRMNLGNLLRGARQ